MDYQPVFEAELILKEDIESGDIFKEHTLKEGYTDECVFNITGIDMQDGGAILISRESWKRLEIFMALLSSTSISISDERIEEALKAKG